MPKLKITNALLCEHAVAGANNKHTLINVYSGDIVVATLPATLTFGLYVDISVETSPAEMTIDMKMDGRVFATIGATFPKPSTSQGSTLVIPLIQAGIDKDLVFEVVAKAEGYSPTTLIKKRIYKGLVPGWSAQAAGADGA